MKLRKDYTWQEKQEIARKYMETNDVYCVSSLIDFLSKCEKFQSEYEDEYQAIYATPDLDRVYDNIKACENIFLVEPENPIRGCFDADWNYSDTYVAISCEIVEVVPEEDWEKDKGALLDYYDQHLNIDDVLPEQDYISLDEDYENSNDFRYGVLAPAIAEYFRPHDLALVEEYRDCTYYVLISPSELYADDDLDDFLQEIWEDGDYGSEYEEFYEFWLVDYCFAKDLKAKGLTVVDVFGFTIWCRHTTGQAIYLDRAIEEIAMDRHMEYERIRLEDN